MQQPRQTRTRTQRRPAPSKASRMAVEPTAAQSAVAALQSAYNEECHVAVEAIMTRVRNGEITSDEALWDAIRDTHKVRVEGSSVTPAWAPLLFSVHRFDTPARPWNPQQDSDVLWELNRIAWTADICHVLAEHYKMTVAGMSRELFMSGNPLDSLTNRTVTIRRILDDLRGVALTIHDDTTRHEIMRHIARLERVTHHLNRPFPLPSTVELDRSTEGTQDEHPDSG